MRSRVLMLSLIVLAGACTATGPDGAPLPSAGLPTVDSAEPLPSGAYGFLGVSLRVRYEGSIYTEGAVAFIEVRNSSGTIVGKERSTRTRVSLPLQLSPGDYQVKTYLRPCDGSCAALDPPRDQCLAPVEISADGSHQFVAIQVVAVVGDCQLSDTGAAIFDASRPDSPSVEVGEPNPLKLFTHCGIDQAAVDFDGNWWDLIPAGVKGDFNDPFTRGTMTLMADGVATFDAPPQGLERQDAEARFLRHEGPIRLPGCY